jgi:hypothetical protein
MVEVSKVLSVCVSLCVYYKMLTMHPIGRWSEGNNLLGIGANTRAFWLDSRSPERMGGDSNIFTLTLLLVQIWSIHP